MPVLAAFALVERGICSFETAWDLVSQGPAKMLGLDDRGTLAEGHRADLVVLDPQTRRVLATFAQGEPVYLTGAVAAALI
jgi:alpha-D-ribose 1-methylphosphonate 5-triphosphate diphosphatase